MTIIVQSPYTSKQIVAWLRGLLTIAWADGDFDEEEQKIIASLTQDELAPKTDLGSLEPISPSELAAALGSDASVVGNFLRTAVMVALADGIYTLSEDKLLRKFFQALKQPPNALNALRQTLEEPSLGKLHRNTADGLAWGQMSDKRQRAALQPVREWLDHLEIHDPRVARFLCKMIPSQCPFERDIQLFGRKVVHIPPLCKLNPLYEQLVGMRFRALSYLADERGEDISAYC